MKIVRSTSTLRNTRVGSSSSLRTVRGFTLLEVMVALTITLILLGLIVEIFSKIGKGVNNSRANMELNDQLRNAKHRLIMDLRGITCPMTPPLDPFMNLGYFEYVEGPRVASSQMLPTVSTVGTSGGDIGMDVGTPTGMTIRQVNTVIGDTDDILMFTTSSFDGEQFVGKGGTSSRSNLSVGITSRHAEVAWFLRRPVTAQLAFLPSLANGLTSASGLPEFFNLHRRQWLVLPEGSPFGGNTYAAVDLSMRPVGGTYDPTLMPPNASLDPSVSGPSKINPSTAPNTLGDLTKRECRSVHQPYWFPHEMMYIFNTNQFYNNAASWPRNQFLSLPTLSEQSWSAFPGPQMETTTAVPGVFATRVTLDPRAAQPGFGMGNSITNSITKDAGPGHPQVPDGTRIGEDIILTNVVSFDVKAWDPGAPIFPSPLVDGTSTTANLVAAVLVPGDGGYPSAVDRFNGSPSNSLFQPIGFGAYADLNYMGTDSDTTDRCLQRWRNYAVSNCALKTMEGQAPYSGLCRLPRPAFAHPGEGRLSGVSISADGSGKNFVPRPCVYDTWSTHYEFDGQSNDYDDDIDELHNGADDNGNGLIDEPNIYNNGFLESGEQDAPPPYRSPLRGIKITIRVMEQESKQVREVTVIQEFIPL